MTASEIQNGHAFCKAAMEVHADLLMTMVKGIDYCTEMKEHLSARPVFGKDKACSVHSNFLTLDVNRGNLAFFNADAVGV